MNLTTRILAGAFGRRPQLRADRIRRDTLTQLAAALREDHDNSVQDALDALIDAVDNPRDTEGAELDGLVADIETEARMSPAVMDLSPADVRQLATDTATALENGTRHHHTATPVRRAA